MWKHRRTKSRQPRATTQTSKDRYRSGFERKLAGILEAAGIPFEYESEKIRYRVERDALYTPDFIFKNGVRVESKGHLTSADRSKYIRVKASNPNLDLRFCFGNAQNKLNKKSKTTYADWADRNGFPWAEKTIPKEWTT